MQQRNHFLIRASCVCTLLPRHLIQHNRGAFCITPNIWLFLKPLTNSTASPAPYSSSCVTFPLAYILSDCHSSPFSHPPPLHLPTHSHFPLSPSSSVCLLCVCLFLPLSLRPIHAPSNGSKAVKAEKIIPRFSAERQRVKIEKVTFHVQF